MEEKIDQCEFVMPRLGLGEQLLSNYELQVTGVSKGRGSLLVYSKDATYMLKEFRGSKERGEALERVLGALLSWDDKNETLVKTVEGECIVREEGGPAYILKRFHPGRECDVKNPIEVMEGVRKLADFHKALQEADLGDVSAFSSPEHCFSQELYRHNRELKNLKNYIRKKKGKTSFEEMYEGAFPLFFSEASEIEEQTKGTQFAREESRMLCHGDYHHHNVMDCGGRSYIVHYENMRLDSPMADLAKYVRKVLEKNNYNSALGMSMIETYDHLCGLDQNEWRELILRLSYPEKFWKIANHYNNNKKAWASKRDGEKLRQVINQEEGRRAFLRLLYNSWE